MVNLSTALSLEQNFTTRLNEKQSCFSLLSAIVRAKINPQKFSDQQIEKRREFVKAEMITLHFKLKYLFAMTGDASHSYSPPDFDEKKALDWLTGLPLDLSLMKFISDLEEFSFDSSLISHLKFTQEIALAGLSIFKETNSFLRKVLSQKLLKKIWTTFLELKTHDYLLIPCISALDGEQHPLLLKIEKEEERIKATLINTGAGATIYHTPRGEKKVFPLTGSVPNLDIQFFSKLLYYSTNFTNIDTLYSFLSLNLELTGKAKTAYTLQTVGNCAHKVFLAWLQYETRGSNTYKEFKAFSLEKTLREVEYFSYCSFQPFFERISDREVPPIMEINSCLEPFIERSKRILYHRFDKAHIFKIIANTSWKTALAGRNFKVVKVIAHSLPIEEKTKLLFSSFDSSEEILHYMIEEENMDPNSTLDGKSLLSVAIEKSAFSTIRYLQHRKKSIQA